MEKNVELWEQQFLCLSRFAIALCCGAISRLSSDTCWGTAKLLRKLVNKDAAFSRKIWKAMPKKMSINFGCSAQELLHTWWYDVTWTKLYQNWGDFSRTFGFVVKRFNSGFSFPGFVTRKQWHAFCHNKNSSERATAGTDTFLLAKMFLQNDGGFHNRM